MRKSIFTFLLISTLTLLLSTSVGGQYAIYTESSSDSYHSEDTVIITIEVSEPSIVTVQVENTSGSTLFVKTRIIDQPSTKNTSVVYLGEVRFSLHKDVDVGAYRYFSSAVNMNGSSHKMISNIFIVSPTLDPDGEDSLIDIIPISFIGLVGLLIALLILTIGIVSIQKRNSSRSLSSFQPRIQPIPPLRSQPQPNKHITQIQRQISNNHQIIKQPRTTQHPQYPTKLQSQQQSPAQYTPQQPYTHQFQQQSSLSNIPTPQPMVPQIQQQPQQWLCPQCRNNNCAEYAFCMNCGYKK